MAYVHHELQALMQVSPDKARARILGALRKTGLHMADAARLLGCGHGTLLRWIDRLGIQGEVDDLRARASREGWHHGRQGGRPPGTTVANGAAPRGSRLEKST